MATDAQLGCGVAEGTTVVAEGGSITLPPACNLDSPAAEQWPALLARDVARYRPDVVVLLAGRWEAFDRPDGVGRLTDITQPGFADDVELQLQRFVSIATAKGARAVLMTAPYYQPAGAQPRPEDDPVRVDDYNRLVAAVVRADPTTTALFRLGALVSPHGRFAATVDGRTVRAPDGLHFPFYSLVDPTAPAPDTYGQVLAFSRWIGPKVLPTLVGAARPPDLGS